MERREQVTFCRICEPLCGLVATVEDGVVTKLRPDPEHPISKGFACPKGIAMTEVQNDPERVVHPLRRGADGEFERVGWGDALADIGRRLRALRDEHGMESVGFYLGNPAAFSYSHIVWAKGMADALGSPHFYSASSQDTSSRFAASALMYGSPLTIPVPDLHRTELLLMVGANPVVSHGSMISGTRVRDDLAAIVERGGRVVVVDPRRSETAKLFEHVAVRPDGDAWLLLSLLHVIFEEGLEDRRALVDVEGVESLRHLAGSFEPEHVARHSGVDADAVRALARDLATARRAAVYGRTGACLGAYGTLVNFLLDALNVVTGNVDRPGGAVFPTPPIDLYETASKRGLDSYATARTRVGGLPEVLGSMPAGVMVDEIRTPGPGQMRALIVTSGNPVLSVPDGPALEAALGELDLLVSIDLGVNDTNRHADYILPATSFLEREDLPAAMFPYQLRTFVQWTDAVVPPRGEARQEWEILRDICAQLGLVPSSARELRRLGRLGRALGPKLLFDAMLRIGPFGDRFGLRRGGLSIAKLRKRYPHGVVLAEEVPTGVLPKRLKHRVRLAPDEIVAEVARLQAAPREDALRLFGRRELRSHNSWMKNSEKLMRNQRGSTLRVHPADAARLGLTDGRPARVRSTAGAIEAVVECSEDIAPGSASLPHGWGRRVDVAGEPVADGGANYNALTTAGPDALEPLAGMSILNGIDIEVEAVA